ncbi:5'-nucleotidase C-terminal domain-containing protein [Alistipes sp. OttesenSCG-928-L06]|nr:5'-nucleotidase C-terminal domain-containing protein [Alistipes sp. OttesenSCG-928-L06]
MRGLIFILILLTVGPVGRAQETASEQPVRLVFTADYQRHLFGQDPVWGGWPDGSLSRALTYIEAHRKNSPPGCFGLFNTGPIPDIYRLPGYDLEQRIREYAHFQANTDTGITKLGRLAFETIRVSDSGISTSRGKPADVTIGFFDRPAVSKEDVARTRGLDLAVIASGREAEVFQVIDTEGDTVTVVNTGTTGKYIGVADFRTARDFSVKVVDISGFPVNAEYEEHFKPLIDSLHAYYTEPLTVLEQTVHQSESLFGASAYTSLFHRFQRETTGADVSFFACPVWQDSIPAGTLNFRSVVRRFRYDNRLNVIELTGAEIKQYLEYTYGLRYNTMRRSTDDLLRMSRDRDGILRPRTAVYNLDDAAGIRYEVDVSRPPGRRVRMLSMADGSPFDLSQRYRVAVNSHRLESGYLTRACGLSPEQISERALQYSSIDLRQALRAWLARQERIVPVNEQNWQVVPRSFVGGVP